jgi:hypothetical protein
MISGRIMTAIDVLCYVTELLENQITFRAMKRILYCDSNFFCVTGWVGLLLFMGMPVYLQVVGIKSSFGWEDKLTFRADMNVCVGMTRFNMIFEVGLDRSIITAEVASVGPGLVFIGVIMDIRKKTINLANAGKVGI